MSIYQKRWASCGSGTTPTITDRSSKNTPTASNVLSSGVEPSTIGTSWNSVRWNKPSTSYRASLASRFENNAPSTTSYSPQRTRYTLSSAAKTAADVASVGPSVSSRASRFDTANIPNKDKYRTEARDLINKWSSRERNTVNNTFRSPVAPRTAFRSTDSLINSTPSKSTSSYSNTAYRTSTSLTPTRSNVITPSTIASRYSAERKSMLSPSPTPLLHTTPKADRPWRQRMAESSRIRSTLGDDVSEGYTSRRAANASSRRSSLSQDESSFETTPFSRVPSSSALVQPYSYRSRQSSVESSVFSPTSRFTSAVSSYVPYSMRNSTNTSTTPASLTVNKNEPALLNKPIIDRSTSRSKSPTKDNLPISSRPSQLPKNASIRESSKEREATDKTKKKSAKERTARRNSRQNSQQDSSSDEEINRLMRSRSNSAVRLRKQRKKSQPEPSSSSTNIPKPVDSLMNKSMHSSMYETGPEEALINSLTASLTESIQSLAIIAGESEGFQSCAASPLAPSISRSSSKNGVVKNQIIKSPSIVEVHGLPKSESRTSLNKINIESAIIDISAHDDELTHDMSVIESLDEPSESSRLDDESQYGAVVHFKPNKVKKTKPVPGLWKQNDANEEFISRNKRFAKEDAHGDVEYTVFINSSEKVSKNLKSVVPDAKKKKNIKVEKKVDPVLKTKVEPKVEEKKPKVTKPEPVVPKAAEPKIDPPKESTISVVPGTTKVTKTIEEPPKLGVEKKKLVLTKKKKILPVEEKKKVVQVPKKEEPPKEENVEISKSFTKKLPLSQALRSLKVQKILKMKNKQSNRLKCKAAGNETVNITEHYRRKPIAERATVLVDTPVKDVNHCIVKLVIRERRKKVPKVFDVPLPNSIPDPIPAPIPVVEPPSAIMSESEVSRSVSRASRLSDTRASVILDEMRYTEAAVEWTKGSDDELIDDQTGETLILPDKSILEHYVNRKRGRFHRMQRMRPSSICSSRGYESSNCASPCPSTVSELCLPSSVVIHEPRKRAPHSAEPTELSMTSVQLNSIPRGFTRNQPVDPPVVKPVPFEAPKTLFEKMIQDQANRNRVTSDTETRDPSPRRGSQEEGMSSISQQFTAAAAGNAAHGQVRYAAHLPVNRASEVSSSGRVSAGSIDSQHSGVLDVASKNIDHVIDQARHRHHQHRSKFKEAIDYLDQIFEDLKKECDPDEKNNNENEIKTNGSKTNGSQHNSNSGSVRSPKSSESSKPNNSVIVKPVAVRAKPVTATGTSTSGTTSTNKVSQKQQPSVIKKKPLVIQQADSPVEVVIPVRKISATIEEPSNQYEPTVTETVVLAKKTDKMDFTRRWLQDDLSSLAHLPPANIAPNASYYHDFDEHSLGSCSAEVAAFNTVKDKKSSKSSRKVSDTSDPVRVRPFRPQPIYPVCDSANSNGNGTSAFEQYHSNTLPRVASTDQISNEMKRSGSQDPYNTLRSMRSEGDNQLDSLRPSPSAFQQVSSFNRGGSMRSSLRSLPDHSPVRHRSSQKEYDDVKDPILSIDQLVAELELNTEQPTSSIDKRRSFPTSFVRPNNHQAQYHVPAANNDYEKPNRYRAEMRHVPTRGRVQGFATSESSPKSVSKAQMYSQLQGQSSSSSNGNGHGNNVKIRENIHRQQKSLDEVTNMLNKVVSQFGADQNQRQQQQSQAQNSHPAVYKQLSQQSFNSNHGGNAFETINQEKINPSRVEAMHNMFEKGTSSTAWKMHQGQPQKQQSREDSFDDRNLSKMSPLQEAQYATLNSYSPSQNNNNSNNNNSNSHGTNNHGYNNSNNQIPKNSSQSQISYHEYTPQLPTSQPPQRPPGSANSSQGGYYSSNSSGIGGSNYQQHQNSHQQNPHFTNTNPRRSLIIDQQSISSRVPSVDEDDDGFYDNIGIYNNDDRRFSRGSELDGSSYRQLPPSSSGSGHKNNRIGSFLRKIGASNNRPPGSAASLMSLNKIANETVIKPVGLMKSNSLSTEPWKKQVLDSHSSMPRESNNNHKTGLGTRLKNSLFGSKKRLDG